MTFKLNVVDYGSKNMQAIRSARTATELRKILGGITGQVQSIASSVDLSSVSANTIELSDIPNVKKRQANKLPLDTIIDVSKIDVSDVKNKAKYNRQVGVLNQALAELGVAYQILSSRTFSAFKNQAESAASLKKVIEEAQEMQNKLVRIMSANVKDGAPKEHTKIAASVANYLTKILDKEQYSKIRTRTFIASGSDPITYQTYVYVDDFSNSEDVKYQNYCVVISTSVRLDDGQSTHYVTTLVDDKIPGSFPMGRKFDSVPSLKKAVNTLMSVDGFLNFKSRKPMRKSTQDLRMTSALGNKTHRIRNKDYEIIDGIRVQDDKLYVRLVRGMSPKEKQQALEEVLAMASTVLRTGRASKSSMTHRIVKGRTGREWVEISLTTNSGHDDAQLTLRKIKEFAKEFDLDDSQLRNLKQAVK